MDEPTTLQDDPSDVDVAAPAFDLRVSADRVTVLLDSPDPLADLQATAALIEAACDGLHLPRYPDRETLCSILETVARPGEHLTDQPLIVGENPTPPRDEELVWARDFFAPGWKVDPETGCMDFREPLAQRSVAADEELCRIDPGEPGRDGFDVFGETLAAHEPGAVRLKAGKNVTESEATDGGRILRAECPGRIRWSDDTVTVDDVYVVGCVSLETGNIHHTGAVTVQGDIKAGSLVEADGDITVQGMVENCRIRCGGSLTVAGGIISDGTGEVEVAGDIHALYIAETNVRAGGDIAVKNEIAHSHVECRGSVHVPAGRIAGGHAEALGGIQVAEAGASGSAHTVLIAGRDPDLPRQLDALRVRLVRMDGARLRLQETLARFRGPEADWPPAQRVAVADLRAKLAEVEEAAAAVERAMADARRESAAAAREEILIFHQVWSGTVVQLRDFATTVRRSVAKPRQVRRHGSVVQLLPMAEHDDDAGES